MSRFLFETIGLKKTYKIGDQDVPALKGVSLQVDAGVEVRVVNTSPKLNIVIEGNLVGEEGMAWIWLTLLGDPLPRCGDGEDDPGEICDDGNTESGRQPLFAKI